MNDLFYLLGIWYLLDVICDLKRIQSSRYDISVGPESATGKLATYRSLVCWIIFLLFIISFFLNELFKKTTS